MSAVHHNPVDYLAEAYSRTRCIQEMLVNVDAHKGLDLGPDATHGLYLLLESVQESIAQARALLEPA